MKKFAFASLMFIAAGAAMAAGKPSSTPAKPANAATRAVPGAAGVKATPALPGNATAAAKVAANRPIK